METVGVALWKQ